MQRFIYFVLIWFFICLFACNQVNKAEIKSADGFMVETFEFIEDSIKHGLQTKYYKKKVREEATYDKGALHGERKIYFANGQVEIVEHYQNGVFSGPYKVYYEDGSLNLEVNYVNGKMQGTLKRYFESGKLMEEVIMVDNEENGPFKEYYDNGKVQWEGHYLNGDNEFGELKQYNEQGDLIKRMMCDSMAICQTIWTLKDGDIVPDKIELTPQEIE